VYTTGNLTNKPRSLTPHIYLNEFLLKELPMDWTIEDLAVVLDFPGEFKLHQMDKQSRLPKAVHDVWFNIPATLRVGVHFAVAQGSPTPTISEVRTVSWGTLNGVPSELPAFRGRGAKV
jgi:hypothetical protein